MPYESSIVSVKHCLPEDSAVFSERENIMGDRVKLSLSEFLPRAASRGSLAPKANGGAGLVEDVRLPFGVSSKKFGNL